MKARGQIYRIELTHTVESAILDGLDEMMLEKLGDGGLQLTGRVADQAALFGLLYRILDANLQIITVEPVADDRDPEKPFEKEV